MKRRLTPQEDKAREYQRKRRTFVGRPSTARRSVPWFEAPAKRTYRRRVHQVLAAERDAADEPGIKRHIPVRPPITGRRSALMSLQTIIRLRRRNRISRNVWKLFGYPGYSAETRQRCVRFLTWAMADRTAFGRETALLFRTILNAPQPRTDHKWHTFYEEPKEPDWSRSPERQQPY